MWWWCTAAKQQLNDIQEWTNINFAWTSSLELNTWAAAADKIQASYVRSIDNTYVVRLMVGFGSRGSVSHVKPTKIDNIIKTKIKNRHIRMALNLSLVNILPHRWNFVKLRGCGCECKRVKFVARIEMKTKPFCGFIYVWCCCCRACVCVCVFPIFFSLLFGLQKVAIVTQKTSTFISLIRCI